MISSENLPQDPPSHLQITNTNNGLEQEKVSSSSVQQDPDLLNPVSIFSLRDYVFSSRAKNLSKNWPFSQKYLGLTMKHGVSDPLPPFQTPDSMIRRNPFLKHGVSDPLPPLQTPDSLRRNPFLKRKSLGEKFCCDGKTHHTHDGEIPKKQNDQLKENRAASECLEINLCGSEETNTDFVSKNTLLELEKHEGEEEVKTHRHPPVKKSKLVKISSEKNVMSESMASRGVCPVCMSFSSSSNTKLNAHIDQCLSGESMMKCAPSLPVTKYKVKPRKTRLIVDIYNSAPYCTLEELDMRNGRNSATNSSFQVQESEARLEEKVEKVSNDNGHVGDVYIDTDGRKVRILSKFSGVESGSKIGGNDNAAWKRQGQKQAKSLKHGKNSLSRKPFRNYEACGSGLERKEPIDENLEKGEMQTERFKGNHNQIKKSNPGKNCLPDIGECSVKDVHQYSGHDNSNTNSVLESGPSTLAILHLKNPISSPKGSQQTEIDECSRQLPSRERKCYLSSRSKIGGGGKTIEKNAGSVKYSDAPARKKPSLTPQGSLSKANLFYSLGNNLDSVVDPTSDSEATYDDEEFAREEVETQMEQTTDGIIVGLNESLNSSRDSEFYQGPVCQMEQTPMGVQETFCSQGQNGQTVAEIEDFRAWQGNYFPDVNAISIPGPPGSFLPSLEDLGSEDLQGNSSLTTCQVQSSEEPQDHAVGFDSKSSDVQTDGVVPTPIVDNYVHVQLPEVQTEDTITIPLVDNYAPADVVPRAPSGAPTGNQWSGSDLDTRIGIPDLNMQVFNSLSSGAENADTCAVKSPDFTEKVSGDYVSPPASNYPVLRLLGKNLVVVNNDQDWVPLQPRHFDGRFSNNFISHVDPPATLLHASWVTKKSGGGSGGGSGGSSSSSTGGGFTGALEKYEGRRQFAN